MSSYRRVEGAVRSVRPEARVALAEEIDGLRPPLRGQKQTDIRDDFGLHEEELLQSAGPAVDQGLVDTLVEVLQPADEVERLIVARIAAAHSRLKSLCEIEARLPGPAQDPSPEEGLSNWLKTMGNVVRFIAAAERSLDRANKELREYRKLKQEESTPDECQKPEESKLPVFLATEPRLACEETDTRRELWLSLPSTEQTEQPDKGTAVSDTVLPEPLKLLAAGETQCIP